jgi:hypothetical protein
MDKIERTRAAEGWAVLGLAERQGHPLDDVVYCGADRRGIRRTPDEYDGCYCIKSDPADDYLPQYWAAIDAISIP